MNVANLDLCNELYELSGWRDCYFGWFTSLGGEDGDYVERNATSVDNFLYPAYDLGYLLRKLPEVYEEPSGVKWILKLEISDGLWDCYYVASAAPKTLADTPEDAACKLAIKLFKRGVLSQ